jgi:hypothetical protein
MNEWRRHAEAVLPDLSAALTDFEGRALEHLRDARANLDRAIEELSNAEDDEG